MTKRFETGSITTWNGGRTNTINVTINSNTSDVSAKSIEDCLNKHMPEPKKTLEYFMGLSNKELNELAKKTKNIDATFTDFVSYYYDLLRPEMKELGYYVDVSCICSNGSVDIDTCKYKLYKNQAGYKGILIESPENPPARIYKIFYLLFKELTR